MALDDFSIDLDTSNSGSEKVSEVSEKFKESVKKASSGLKRTQKDEAKAKKYDFLLASFLVKIILDKKYDSILENVFKVMDFGYNSNLVLGILSLINLEISDKIREISKKENIVFDFRLEQEGEFNDENIRPPIKNRINLWIEDIVDAVTIEYSNIQNKKNLEILENDSQVLSIFTAQVFSFFLKEANIIVTKPKAIAISNFIISEVKNYLKKIDIIEI